MKEVSMPKKRTITSFRRKKNLCELCGCVESDVDHICYENYVKVDMREVELSEDDVIEIHNNDEEETNVVEIEDEVSINDEVNANKVKTIVSYRQRKNLCLLCGTVDIGVDHECVEDYSEADRRSYELKKEDPRTVITPKEKIQTIEEKQAVQSINYEFINNHPDDYFRLTKTEDIQSLRKFIIIDINKSETGQKFSVDYLKFMSSKHKNYIIYVIGNIDELYSFKEANDLKKLSNFCPIKNVLDQNIVNHIHGCVRYFGFPSKNVTYCMCYNIPCTTFFDNSEELELPCNIVNVKSDEDITLDHVKLNVLTWKL